MFKRLLLIVTMIMSLVPLVSAATTQTVYKFGSMKVLVIEWTAETDGSFISATTNAINGVVALVETKPGSTAPTSLYDVTLKNNNNYDIMGGKLSDRSAVITEAVVPYDSVNDLYLTHPVRGPLTIDITNNSVNSATGSIIIYYFN